MTTRLLVLLVTTRARRARTSTTATRTATATTTTATITTSTVTATAAIALLLRTTVTLNRLEAVVATSRGTGSLGMVVSPRLDVGRGGRGSLEALLGLSRIALNLDPLLRAGHVSSRGSGRARSIPAALSSRVGGAVTSIGLGGSAASSRLLFGLSVGQSNGRAIVNLGEAGVGNSKIGLGFLLGLDSLALSGLGLDGGLGPGGLGNGLLSGGLGEGSGVGDSDLLNLGNCKRS